MARQKLSVAVDPAKLSRARQLVPAASVSELFDIALGRLIDDALEQRHVDGYARRPAGGDEVALAEAPRSGADVADETDWASIYGSDDGDAGPG